MLATLLAVRRVIMGIEKRKNIRPVFLLSGPKRYDINTLFEQLTYGSEVKF